MRTFIFALILSTSELLSAQNPGDIIFNSAPLVHEIRISLPDENWYETLVSNYEESEQTGNNIYLMGTLEFDGIVKDSVGFKFKGNSSYNNPEIKKSWKISTEEFTGSNEIDDENEFNLNNCFKDPSFMREKLYLDFLNHYQIPAPRCAYADVYVNDELFGFYTLVEEIDKKFLETHFGNKDHNLYKGDPHGDLRWQGSSIAPYQQDYEKKTNETENDWSDLVWLIDNINNSAEDIYMDSLNACLNTASYIQSWASSLIFCNFDSYTGSGHNYFLYHNSNTNQFEWINWDVNEAFGSFSLNNSISNMISVPIDYVPAAPMLRPLNSKMKDQETYWSLFQHFICQSINDYFNADYMYPIVDSLYLEIRNHVYADPNKLYTNADFDQNIEQNLPIALGIKPFISQRSANLQTQLANVDCSSLSIFNNAASDIEIFPNPFSDELYLNYTQQGNELISLEILDTSGRTMANYSTTHSEKIQIQTDQLQTGIYLIKIKIGDQKQSTKKIICIR